MSANRHRYLGLRAVEIFNRLGIFCVHRADGDRRRRFRSQHAVACRSDQLKRPRRRPGAKCAVIREVHPAEFGLVPLLPSLDATRRRRRCCCRSSALLCAATRCSHRVSVDWQAHASRIRTGERSSIESASPAPQAPATVTPDPPRDSGSEPRFLSSAIGVADQFR